MERILDLLAHYDVPRSYFEPFYLGDPSYRSEHSWAAEQVGRPVAHVRVFDRSIRVGGTGLREGRTSPALGFRPQEAEVTTEFGLMGRAIDLAALAAALELVWIRRVRASGTRGGSFGLTTSAGRAEVRVSDQGVRLDPQGTAGGSADAFWARRSSRTSFSAVSTALLVNASAPGRTRPYCGRSFRSRTSWSGGPFNRARNGVYVSGLPCGATAGLWLYFPRRRTAGRGD